MFQQCLNNMRTNQGLSFIPNPNPRDLEDYLQFNNYIRVQGKVKLEPENPSAKLYLDYLLWVIAESKSNSTQTLLNACYILGQVEQLESYVSAQIQKKNSSHSSFFRSSPCNHFKIDDYGSVDWTRSKAQIIHEVDNLFFGAVNSSLYATDMNRAKFFLVSFFACIALSVYVDHIRQNREANSLLALQAAWILLLIVSAALGLRGNIYYSSARSHDTPPLFGEQAIEWVDCTVGHPTSFILESAQQAINSIQNDILKKYELTTALTLSSLVTTRYKDIREGSSNVLPRLSPQKEVKIVSVQMEEDTPVILEDIVNRLRLKLGGGLCNSMI